MPTKNTKKPQKPDVRFLETIVPRPLIMTTFFVGIIYFLIITFAFPLGYPLLYGLLIGGQLFHLWLLFTFLYTIWDTEGHLRFKRDPSFSQPVDIFVTVAGEPIDIVRETIEGIKKMDYPSFEVYILNDGYVAKKENWQEMEKLALDLSVHCITRKEPGGAKAGNINNGIRHSSSPYIAIFDADHIPHPDFLKKMMPYFVDAQVAFVQSPQYYKNHALNFITQGAWDQQELFFGPICKGKNRLNSATMCGTNMVISRKALEEVNGMCEDSIAEDFLTGLFMHNNGWKSVFHPEVLAEGLAPEDFLSYYKQQFRWARGGFDLIFKYNVLAMKKITLTQKLQYFSSLSFYLSGGVLLMYSLLPLVFFYIGLVPFKVATLFLAITFLPYIILTLYTLQKSANSAFTFLSIAFSMCSFSIHLEALFLALIGKKATFEITSKTKLSGNFLRLVKPHIAYVVLGTIGICYAFWRDGATESVMGNTAWTLLYMVLFSQFIYAAAPKKRAQGEIITQTEVVAEKIT